MIFKYMPERKAITFIRGMTAFVTEQIL